ncbi:MAG: hypothetical protein IJU79_02560 [Desulfovibrionaceae bacterium]|nr:hypothetical protein [Desulfovibrionaceae bacterium]
MPLSAQSLPKELRQFELKVKICYKKRAGSPSTRRPAFEESPQLFKLSTEQIKDLLALPSANWAAL